MLASDDDLTALLHLAEQLVLAMGLEEGDVEGPCRAHPTALQKLRLQLPALDEVRGTVRRELERIGKLLNPEAPASR
jgi:hypothetical protein